MATKRQTLIDAAMKYVNNDKLNLTEMRKDNNSLYVRICNVFENIADFKQSIAPIECVYTKDRAERRVFRSDSHIPAAEIASLRNELAYQKIVELRKTMTYEQIAKRYGVSKQGVHELHAKLTEFYGRRLTEMLSFDYNQNTLYLGGSIHGFSNSESQ
ncbi:hypothetical protein UFOVP453_14 [uncultured Caudovirales phage]|uniref:Uncharacterized protein n=1 Tax=uncultured Caudovirales phage TaxID=2100421 RepID=A0A6J5MCH0_9CAUD|nr:hypothetical protein UFOVP453_14 [uncultured Caudovirales phage]